MIDTKKIGLCMIVKNESHVIRRCLDSVLPLLDYALICDTGSTDGTQDLVRAYLAEKGLPGEVVERPWVDFAHNRTEALEALRGVDWIDYALVIDADDALEHQQHFDVTAFKSSMDQDVYDVRIRSGSNVYLRPQIFRNEIGFRYRGVLHEFLETPKGAKRRIAEEIFIRRRTEGARSQDPDKFRKDVSVLRTALEHETDPFLESRYRFYLAQSYRDAGEHEKALAEYLHRAELGYWIEEVFVSLYQAGKLMERLERPHQDTLEMFLRAYNTHPTRAEALQGAARVCRMAERYEEAYFFAKRGLEVTPSPRALFVDSTTYAYGLLDELQISAYWTGRYQESLEHGERLLRESRFPPSQRRRIEDNVASARRKVGGQA